MFLLFAPNLILILAAVLPALFLLLYVYRHDRIEKEPMHLLGQLVLQGAIATAIAKFVEGIGLRIVGAIAREGTVFHSALLYFVVVGFAEEGAKYLQLKRMTWGIPDYNCRFDGVVYAAFVSLGFALWENISYVFTYGFSTAVVRAFTAVPGHLCFGIYMGCWYAQAYEAFRAGDEATSRTQRRVAVVLPALIHGAYDFLADMTAISPWYFLIFVGILFVVTFRFVRRLSAEDGYLR